MCISVGGNAHFTGTGVHAARIKHPNTGRLVHTLGYTVDASVPDYSWITGKPKPASSARALFIAVPAKKETLTPDNMIDTTGIEKFIRNQGEQLFPEPASRNADAPMSWSPMEKGVTVSECGKFTVVTADNARKIHGALSLVREDRRPVVPAPFLGHMQQMYGGADWSFVLACFNEEIGDTATFFLWYEPQDETELFLPGFDEHTGNKLPMAGEPVKLDHIITVYAPDMVGGTEISYEQFDAVAANGFIPTCVRGFDARELTADNGDFAVQLDHLKETGTLKVRRKMPPGAFLGQDYQEKFLEVA